MLRSFAVNYTKLILLSAMLFLYGITSAQTYEVTRYADDNGLPTRIVIDVDQDSVGFLWIAGNNGLHKFDGQQFHSYYTALNDTTGLRDNKINTVLAAKNGIIWIATPVGLHHLKNDTIEYFPLTSDLSTSANHITDLFEDSHQNIWVSSYKGFYMIEKGTRAVREFTEHNPNLQKDYPIWAITEDSKGRIWVCQGGRPPLIAEPQVYIFKELPLLFAPTLKLRTLNAFAYLDIDGQNILISSGSGLLRGTLTAQNELKVHPFYNAEGEKIATEFLYHTLIDDDQNIWTATWKNRFKKYQLKDTLLIESKVVGKNGWINMANHCRSVFQDAQNNIWIPNVNGLHKLSETQTKMNTFPPVHDFNCLGKSFAVLALTEDNGNHLWINTDSHLLRIDKADILANNCPTDYLKVSSQHFIGARNILIDSENRLWVSGSNGGP